MTNKKDILFGGGRLPPKIPEFRKPKDRAKWFVSLEEAFFKLTSSDEGKRLYGDPNKGATLEQTWRTSGIFTGKWPVCLLSTEKAEVQTAAIKRLIKMNSKKLVEVLADLFDMNEKLGVQILYHDGYMGHSITLIGYSQDTARFTYHDPWPEYSLLCKDYNAAGIDAQREEIHWSITAAELEKVIFAAFVFQNVWAEYVDEKYYLTYDELKATDFWSFFHVTEADKHTLSDSKSLFFLRTGGFQSEIDLSVSVNYKGRLVEGQLKTNRSWMFGPPYGLNPFALDIVRSFIFTMIPHPDKEENSGLLNMFNEIQDPNYAQKLIDEGPDKSILHRALFTYVGASPSFEAIFEFSCLNMSNVEHDDARWLETKITIDAL